MRLRSRSRERRERQREEEVGSFVGFFFCFFGTEDRAARLSACLSRDSYLILSFFHLERD